MTLESLIKDFDDLKYRIAVAAQNNDGDLLRSLDADIQKVFEQILVYIPSSNEQRIAHCNFLLENLIPAEKRQGASKLICDKIMEMVSET